MEENFCRWIPACVKHCATSSMFTIIFDPHMLGEEGTSIPILQIKKLKLRAVEHKPVLSSAKFQAKAWWTQNMWFWMGNISTFYHPTLWETGLRLLIEKKVKKIEWELEQSRFTGGKWSIAMGSTRAPDSTSHTPSHGIEWDGEGRWEVGQNNWCACPDTPWQKASRVRWYVERKRHVSPFSTPARQRLYPHHPADLY